ALRAGGDVRVSRLGNREVDEDDHQVEHNRLAQRADDLAAVLAYQDGEVAAEPEGGYLHDDVDDLDYGLGQGVHCLDDGLGLLAAHDDGDGEDDGEDYQGHQVGPGEQRGEVADGEHAEDVHGARQVL